MATFFGEVILPSSRAFFDDKDDSDYENGDSETTVTREKILVNIKNSSCLDAYNVLFVSDGSIARDFIQNYIAGEKRSLIEYSITPDQQQHDETEMIYSKKISIKPILVATLHEINASCLYLDTSSSLKLSDANHLTLHISDWLEKCEDVVVIASRSVSDYKYDSHETVPSTFVKSLATSSTSLPTSCSRLEQPNFISGFAASVMSWCEVKKKKCVLHTCYSDALFSDSVTLAPLVQCFSNSSFENLLSSKTPDDLKHNNPVHLNVMYQ